MTRRLLGWMPILLVALVIAGVAVNRAHGAADNDLWWHLRLGADFLQQGNLRPPEWSPFSDRAWVPTEPVPEVVAALAERWAGLDGVMWLYAVACIALVLALHVGNRAVGRPLAAMVGTVVAVLGCSLSFTPRPHLVSFVLLTVVFRAWNRTAEDLQPRWYLIPMVYGWSLCHGFWFIGAGYGFLEIAGLLLDRRVSPAQCRSLLLVAILSTASVLLNPLGIGVFEAPFAVNEVRKYASEWEHTTPTMLPSIVVLLVQVALLVLWWRLRGVWSWRRVLLLTTSVFWVWYAWRTVALASIVVAPLLTEALEALLRRTSGVPAEEGPSTRAEGLVLGGTALVSVLMLLLLVPASYDVPDTNSAIDRRLDQLPAGSVVFNEFGVGGYLAWRHPDLCPVIDGLITPYSPEYVDTYFRSATLKPGWRRFLHASGAHVAVLLSRSRITRVLEDEAWRPTAQYHDYVLLERRGRWPARPAPD